MTPTFAVLLAGGASTRLFPFNKALSDLTGCGRTLLQQSYDRVTATLPRGQHRRFLSPDHFYAIASDAMALPIRAQLRLPSSHIFVDPARRGTWPAILWALAHLRRRDPEAVVCILTADQLIPQVDLFRRGVAQAIDWARRHPAIVMLGVTPDKSPESWRGFGCFKLLPAVRRAGHQRVPRAIVALEEKPTAERASHMMEEGEWSWNAGLFFFRIATAETALRRFQPAMADIYGDMCRAIAAGHSAQAKRRYAQFPSHIPHPLDPSRQVDNTIDYAVMMPIARSPSSDVGAWGLTGALPSWTDVGEWGALRGLVKCDGATNVKIGSCRADRATRGCILVADDGHRIEVKGLRRVVAALSGSTALLLPEADLPRMKEIVAEVRARPKERVILLGGASGHIQARGGRVVMYGLQGFRVTLLKNRLRVESASVGHIE